MGHLIGIDPGKLGGLCFMSTDGHVSQVLDMPIIKSNAKKAEVDICLIDELALALPEPPVVVAIELVNAVHGSAPISAFTFGRNFETLLTWCKLSRLPYQLVAPKDWKKLVLAGTDKSKQAALAHVHQRYPYLGAIKADGQADAICIAEWALRSCLGASS